VFWILSTMDITNGVRICEAQPLPTCISLKSVMDERQITKLYVVALICSHSRSSRYLQGLAGSTGCGGRLDFNVLKIFTSSDTGLPCFKILKLVVFEFILIKFVWNPF
jgi:hypothetical protein